jgi:hypothetical protein
VRPSNINNQLRHRRLSAVDGALLNMKHYSNNKDVNKLATVMERQGWRVNITDGGHIRWLGPLGELVFSGTTPSDHRELANLKARIRRQSKMARQALAVN